MNDIVETRSAPPIEADRSLLATLLSDTEKLKDVPVENIERLYDIADKMEKERQRKAFNAAFLAAQSEFTPVVKKHWNEQTKSYYAKGRDVLEMVTPIINKHGFTNSVSVEPVNEKDMMRFVLIVRHIEGHEERHYMDAPIDNVGIKGTPNKTRLHGMGSAYSYAERYLTGKVWNVLIVDDDDDGNQTALQTNLNKITDEQYEDLVKLAEQAKMDMDRIKTYFKLDDIRDLNQHDLASCRATLLKRIKQNAGNVQDVSTTQS